MSGKYVGACALILTVWAAVACQRGKTQADLWGTDTVAMADTFEVDTLAFPGDEDEGLSLENHTTEFFLDFIFAFTHNGRFQAERIRFPLPVTDTDGTERKISSGRQFRSEFQMPGNDYYTLLLANMHQMEVFQADSVLQEVDFQCVRLGEGTVSVYNFSREEGRWYLNRRTDKSLEEHPLAAFFHFYERFATDSLYQQECVARNIKVTMDEDGEEEEMEGIIDRDQWPMFRPEMPGLAFVNMDFGQSVSTTDHRLHLLQCGISNGMLDVFTFQRESDRWQLVSYEN